MDVREKLVELILQEDDICELSECKDCGANGSCGYYRIADRLIANSCLNCSAKMDRDEVNMEG